MLSFSLGKVLVLGDTQQEIPVETSLVKYATKEQVDVEEFWSVCATPLLDVENSCASPKAIPPLEERSELPDCKRSQ